MRSLLARLRPPADTSDRQLLDRFRAARDEAAFAELVRRHGPLVWGVCRRTLPPADAEDAFQATFLLLVRRAGFTPAGSVAPWLYRAAVLTARTARRADRRRQRRVRVGLPAAEPVAPASDFDLRDAVDVALLSLPARDRAAVLLCHVQGHTRAEAARLLGVPEGTLSARLSRALARLRARLGGHEPAAVLAVAGAGLVPAELAAAAGRAGVIYLAGGAVPPAVAMLTHGAAHMGWVKTLTAAGLVLAAVAGTGVGVGLRAGPPPAAPPPADRIKDLEGKLADLAARIAEADDRIAELTARRAADYAEWQKLDTALAELRAKANGRPDGLVLTDAGGGVQWNGVGRYVLTEPTDAGEPLRYTVSDVPALVKLLARTRAARPDQPVRVQAEPHLPADAAAWLVWACKEAGYETVRYTGPDLPKHKKLTAGPGRAYKQTKYSAEGLASVRLAGTITAVVRGEGGQKAPENPEVDMYAGTLDLAKWK